MESNKLLFFTLAVLFSTRYTSTACQAADSSKLSLRIVAHNLSEDMTRMSSKNDELMILIYSYETLPELSSPVFSRIFTLSDRSNELTLDGEANWIDENDTYLFFLVERDSGAGIEQIDPVIRVHHQRILEAFKAKDYIELEKYLGDEDLLGFKTISGIEMNKGNEFDISGFYKMDKYEYSIKIEPNK